MYICALGVKIRPATPRLGPTYTLSEGNGAICLKGLSTSNFILSSSQDKREKPREHPEMHRPIFKLIL